MKPADQPRIGRRDFLATSAALAALNSATAKAGPDEGQSATPAAAGDRPIPVRAISSANGLEATQLAYQQMLAGVDTLQAVVAGVTLVEDDPADTSVGFGGLPNEDGVVELDAAVMHGPTHRAGAVASLQKIRNPAQVALKVLERSDHVLLVGPGALEFARAHGFEEQDLLTDKARRIWLHWKETLSDKDDWLAAKTVDDDVAGFFGWERRGKGRDQRLVRVRRWQRPTGTIHCAGINAQGQMSCTTTTSGLAFKIPGRVGDSPIIGAGLYCDNDVGSCGSTGRGEANLQNLCSHAAVELMRGGMSPAEAGLEVLKRVARKTSEAHLLDDQGRPNFNLKFYIMNRHGEYAGLSMWGPSRFAVTDAAGTRHEECQFLYRQS